jgi:predicted CoA-substrate-specific enzyme activase
MKSTFIGIDAGSVSTKIALISESGVLNRSEYILHKGDPVGACKKLSELTIPEGQFIGKAAVTGSARKIAGRSCNADVIKNEITALWRSIIEHYPDARTIIEIGGQDSKLISLRDGEIDTFRLNSVCAAGTGSFIQQQAARLGLTLEELSQLSIPGTAPARFTGRCTVFVETEMINLQQQGYSIESIAAGLSDAVCENYLKDLSPGINLEAPFVFCGGVAMLDSVLSAFSRKLSSTIIRPDYFRVAGAYGAALLARDIAQSGKTPVMRTLIFSENSSPVKRDEKECTDCLMCGKCSDV